MWILIASLFAMVALVVGGVALYTYLRFRSAHFVKCPENGAVTAVSVDARYAAVFAALGNPQLRLNDCTRWPEMQGCGQECLKQIEYAPEDCLVRNVVAEWYRGRRCVVCGHTFGVIHWHDHAPALLDSENRTVLWSEVPLARLVEFMDTHQPVCWDCHVVQSFRREHPELVTFRKER